MWYAFKQLRIVDTANCVHFKKYKVDFFSLKKFQAIFLLFMSMASPFTTFKLIQLQSNIKGHDFLF